MGAFGGILLTNKGRNLQTKAQTGTSLKYTRIAIGDGQLGGQSIATLNKLISEKKSLSITHMKVQGEGQAVVGTVLSNQDVQTGFYFREIGLFAEDPDAGEILYCYGNAGENAEYIPPSGGADLIEKQIDMNVFVGQAENVSATVDSKLGVSQNDVDEAVKQAKDYTDQHAANKDIHVTAQKKQEWDAKLPLAGGTLTGPLTINAEAAALRINGKTHAYIPFYPKGDNDTRGGYLGYGDPNANHLHIANEYVDGDVVVKAYGQDVLISDLNQSFRARAGVPSVTDLNQYTTTGFYQLAPTTGFTNVPAGVEWAVLEISAYPNGYVIQRITSVTDGKSFYRARDQATAWTEWIEIGGGAMSKIMIPSDNVKHTDPQEHSYTSTGYSRAYIKIFTMQPNMKGTFRISADVAWSHATIGGNAYEISLLATTADRGANNTTYGSGTDNQTVINSFHTPVGTGTEDVNAIGNAIHGNSNDFHPIRVQTVPRDEFRNLKYAVAMTGDYPVSVYAHVSYGQANQGLIIKAKNINVSYDLI